MIINPTLDELLDILEERDQLIIYTYKDSPPIVTIGAPHQVPKGKNEICLDTTPRNGDTDSGLLALEIFNCLKELKVPTKLIIKSRPMGEDPNKDLHTDYSQEIIKIPSKILFEIHGQSSRNKHPLEFSAGRNDISKITRFGLYFYEELRQLQKDNKLEYIYEFGIQEKKDSSRAIIFKNTGEINCGELELPALRSLLIDRVENYGMSAFHLETMPQFRFQSKTSRDLLSRAVSRAIYKLLIDKDFKEN